MTDARPHFDTCPRCHAAVPWGLLWLHMLRRHGVAVVLRWRVS